MAGAADALQAGAAALAAGGAAWAAWAGWCLWRAGNPLRPGAPPQVMVDHGPYRFGRHPMYLGLTLLGFGLGLALQAPLLAAAAFVGAVTVHGVLIPAEEALLRRTFGGWYSDYMTDVRRWL